MALSKSMIRAAVITQIQLGVMMARASGVQCGEPRDIKIAPIRRPSK